MSSITFRVNHRGIAELLVSSETRAVVRAKAEAVAQVARSAYPDLPIKLEDATGRRARYRVVGAHPMAKNVEAKHRVLGRALEAAR